MIAHEQEMRAYFSSQRKHAGFLKSIIGSSVIECVYNKQIKTLCEKSGERFDALLRLKCFRDYSVRGI